MTYLQLRDKIATKIFTLEDVEKIFWPEAGPSVRMQLSRLVRKGRLVSLKRGLYAFSREGIDELELTQHLYAPAYISLESALNYYGVIPDIPLGVTAVTTVTTKKIKNDFGTFTFYKVKPELFFGFTTVLVAGGGTYNLALLEKALLDYFYLRRLSHIADRRLDLTGLDRRRYNQFADFFPAWVQKINLND
ncbi:MAG: hypothetical protein M1484_04865 [Patescibacteria group bacterium]|nr:hypothetical protein [Patescibacteria group bacterium]